MAELSLFPDERVVFQAAIYVIGLACAHYFIVKPLLSLHLERLKRSSGAAAGAQSEEARIDSLEKQYANQLSAAKIEANDLRNKEVLSGQASASAIVDAAQEDARNRLEEYKIKIELRLQDERAGIEKASKLISSAVIQKLGSSICFLVFFGFTVFNQVASASGGGPVDFWYGIFWPTFQFILFAVALWYFGRAAVEKILLAKRDKLRTQLSEARQSVQIAEGKIAEYEAKIARLKSDIETIRKTHVDEGLRQRNELIEEANKVRSQILLEIEKRQNDIFLAARETLKRDLIDETMKAVYAELTGSVLLDVDSRLKRKALDLVQRVQ